MATLSLPTDFRRPRFRTGTAKLHCCAFANVRKAQLMKTERSESHHEAAKALAFAITGVVAVMLIWNVMMLIFY